MTRRDDTLLIRDETGGDVDAIGDVHRAAFADHPFSRQTEHLIVQALRQAGALTLSLVAVLDGRVVGHVAFSPAGVGDTDGDAQPGWYLLGPVGVLPGLQRQGMGSRLVREGLARLERLSARGCILVGDPAYYARFGFRTHAGLVMDGIPPEVILAKPFTGTVPRARVTHHPAFAAGQ